MSRVAIVGAGPTGLACGYRLLKAGHEVTLFEADDRPGGMSAHFDFEGLDIERFYHFVCASDEPLFELLHELGIHHELHWRDSSMGYFYDGELYPWGDPISLLRFPGLSLLSKLRYGLHVFSSTKRNDWSGLDRQNAIDWVKKWVGDEVYDVVWRPLFELKFFHYCDDLSAAWIMTRIRRMGRSRRNPFQERLGYLRGGSQTLIRRIVDEIEAMGGSIRLRCGVQEIELGDTGVTAVRTADRVEPFTFAASTVPIPYVTKMIPKLPERLRERYARLDNIGAVCVLFKLRRPLSKHFWLNTSDPEIETPGVIEYSNLQPLDEHVVYVPYYLPQDHPKFGQSDEAFTDESLRYLARINPRITREEVKAVKVSRLRYAQPICPRGFAEMLPPMETEVRGLYIADTSYYYPEDRSMSESVRLGQRMASAIQQRAASAEGS